jgi:poly(hydroxyalkanoate) depolymerase family esterase
MREAIAAAMLAGGGAAALGAPSPGAEGRFLSGAVGEGSVRREYRLYVPGSYDSARPAPLVVFLHGCTQDPDDLARGTRMNEVAERAGFLVLYPTQPATANGLKCWNWFDPGHQRRGAGEPAHVEAMTRQVMREWRVDARRVHVAGISAGGAMALVVAAAYPELYASVASHSGIAVGVVRSAVAALPVMRAGPPATADLLAGLRAAGGDGARAIPLLVMHGTADPTVSPANAQAIAQQWSAAFALEPIGTRMPAALAPGVRPYSTALRGRSVEVPLVEVVMVDGLGHAWSGGSAAGTYADPQGPSASELIAEFFARHPMPEPGR